MGKKQMYFCLALSGVLLTAASIGLSILHFVSENVHPDGSVVSDAVIILTMILIAVAIFLLVFGFLSPLIFQWFFNRYLVHSEKYRNQILQFRIWRFLLNLSPHSPRDIKAAAATKKDHLDV
ncbi:MAG: hypothetical protein AAGI36_13875 [Pseudomonadota bacterium]